MTSARPLSDHVRELPDHVREFAAGQHGVISSAQLGRLGVAYDGQSRLVRDGALVRLAHGAYVLASEWAVATPWERYELRVRAVALPASAADPQQIVVSHVSAAALWGLPLLSPQPTVHLLSANGSRQHRRGIRRHHSAFPDDTRVVSGVRVTSLRRTVVDCCAMLPLPDAVAIADSGLARLCTRDGARRTETTIAQEIHREDLIDLLGRRRPRGTVSAREALLFADARSGSAAESRARVLLQGLGLPRPELQREVVTAYGIYYPDFCFERMRVLVEMDGVVKVQDPYGGDPIAAVERERRRHIHLQEEGWEIVRLTWEDLAHPDRIRERIGSAAQRARLRGLAPS